MAFIPPFDERSARISIDSINTEATKTGRLPRGINRDGRDGEEFVAYPPNLPHGVPLSEKVPFGTAVYMMSENGTYYFGSVEAYENRPGEGLCVWVLLHGKLGECAA